MNIKPEHHVIYEKLQDEESRQLFWCRYQYYLDGDVKHLIEEQSVTSRFNDAECAARWKSLIENEFQDDGVVLFGAGNNYNPCLAAMKMGNVVIRAVCDNCITKIGLDINGHVIVSPKTALSEHFDCNFIITPTKTQSKQEMYDYLVNAGISPESIYFYYYRTEKQYFGPDFIMPESNEVFIDAGCFDGETIMDFYEFAGQGKVYGFEPDQVCYDKTLHKLSEYKEWNVKIYNKGLWNSAETLRFSSCPQGACSAISNNGDLEIETVALDEVVDSSEKITFIKMDIEGAELNALIGSSKTIQCCLPRLAICIYHKPEDIVEIPLYILSLHNDYKLYIRHHVPWLNNETVLYAIP